MKHIFSILICLLLVACAGSVKFIPYTPDISNVKGPILTIKTTLEEQPSMYAYAPAKIEVTDRCIILYWVDRGFLSIFSGTLVPTNYCYKDFGIPRLSKDPIWNVEIIDKSGYNLYNVYMQEEKDAKEFINALYYMIKSRN